MMKRKTLRFSVALSIFLPILAAEAQDVDVPGNLTMRNSTDGTVGNVLKDGVSFIHNFGTDNTFLGINAGNLTMSGGFNTASGFQALLSNSTGNNNTALGFRAGPDNLHGHLFNATAIGAEATVDASNKIRLGNEAVRVIEGLVGFTANSDRNQQENFRPLGEEVLRKIGRLSLTSWNFIGQDPGQFRHYGPAAQDFFAAFGNDGIGTIGTPTTITSTDIDGILMVAVQALERRTEEKNEQIDALRAENVELKARLVALEPHGGRRDRRKVSGF